MSGDHCGQMRLGPNTSSAVCSWGTLGKWFSIFFKDLFCLCIKKKWAGEQLVAGLGIFGEDKGIESGSLGLGTSSSGEECVHRGSGLPPLDGPGDGTVRVNPVLGMTPA